MGILNPSTATAAINNYYSGATTGATWSTTSTTLADPTPSGTNTLTQRQANGITVTTAASNLPGISFTPAASTSVYLVTVSFAAFNGTAVADSSYFSLTDGTTPITTSFQQGPGSSGGAYWVSLTGIYVPGTGSAITIKVQAAASAGTTSIGFTNSVTKQLEWSVVQIR